MSVYEYQADPISQSDVELFLKATQTDHSGFPLTFATKYREGEFKIVQALNIDLRQLLHSEQSYLFVEPLRGGDKPLIRTRVKENKTKRGIQFLTFETEVICSSVKKMVCESTMVIGTA